MLPESSRKGSTYAFFALGSSGILALLSSSIVSYLGGPEIRGSFSLLLLITSLATIVGSLGMGEAIVVNTRPVMVPANRHFVLLIVSLACFSAFTGALGGLVLSHLVTGGLNAALVASCLLMSVANSLWLLPGHLINGLRQYRLWNILKFSSALTWALGATLAVTVIPIYSNSVGNYLLLATSIFFLGSFLNGVIAFKALRRGKVSTGYIPKPLIHKLLRSGLWIMGAGVLLSLNRSIDQFLLGSEAGVTDVGLYSAAIAYGGIFTLALLAISDVALPSVAATPANPGRQAVKFIFGIMFLVSISLLPATLLAPVIVPLLNGPQFTLSEHLAVLLAPAMLFEAATIVFGQMLKGLGMERWVLILELGRLVIFTSLVVLIVSDTPAAFAMLRLCLAVGILLVATVLVLRGANVQRDDLLRPVRLRELIPLFKSFLPTRP